MFEFFEHAFKDTIHLVPFLFMVFLILEFIEHKLSKKSKKVIEKSGKIGPLIGSILGAFPQCGFSVAAVNLYVARIISIGTLIAIFLSTSDEMLPILLSKNIEISIVLKIIGLKVLIAIILGFIIDFIWPKEKEHKDHIHELCDEHHCGCEKNILKSTIKHTLNITLYIFIINFIFTIIIHTVGNDAISKLLMKNTIFEPILTSILGLIPNCSSSVIITELYLENAISFGAMMSGLLTGSGVALMVLFKENKNLKENIKILCTIYFLGVAVGIIFYLFGVKI